MFTTSQLQFQLRNAAMRGILKKSNVTESGGIFFSADESHTVLELTTAEINKNV